MKTHFNNRQVSPVTAAQLVSVSVDPDDLFWSPTFHTWSFCGPLRIKFPYSTMGAILSKLNLTPNPEA
jgi:hypothetical protein